MSRLFEKIAANHEDKIKDEMIQDLLWKLYGEEDAPLNHRLPQFIDKQISGHPKFKALSEISEKNSGRRKAENSVKHSGISKALGATSALAPIAAGIAGRYGKGKINIKGKTPFKDTPLGTAAFIASIPTVSVPAGKLASKLHRNKIERELGEYPSNNYNTEYDLESEIRGDVVDAVKRKTGLDLWAR